MSKIRYYLKKLVGMWPPTKGSPPRTIYDLKDADESYKGRR